MGQDYLDSEMYLKSGAVISVCGRYRFQLWRSWDESKPLVMWVGHNPSTADANTDDPTIRRMRNFSIDWGYGGMYVGNLFPYRATNPNDLKKIPFEKIAPSHQFVYLQEMISKCELHILAYGNPVIPGARPDIWDNRWHYLKKTKLNNPAHPLYLSKNLRPKPINDS